MEGSFVLEDVSGDLLPHADPGTRTKPVLLELYIALSWAELADFSEFVGKDEQASAEESRAGS